MTASASATLNFVERGTGVPVLSLHGWMRRVYPNRTSKRFFLPVGVEVFLVEARECP
ncbi:hypothetical protein [Streptomyces sp. NPDC005303]|uniref:hypothetical protein n=1 Tax=Streptomyces sp. NPDC005303 TaxID=3155713 RepID=UPI0033ADA382